jgi:hypothetical protein
MGFATRYSLRQEYDLFVEREIEDYKERLPRAAILKIADEAVDRLHDQEQVALNELILCDEVDRIITARLRLPTFPAWARKRRKVLATLRRPESWGMAPDDPLVRNLPTSADAHVLVAQPMHESAALFLAANGCTVTTVEPEESIVQRVMDAADKHGLSSRVSHHGGGLAGWAPDHPLSAVICSPAAFAGLSSGERSRVLAALQGATRDGGVHLVETIVAGQHAMDLDELRASYQGWTISVEPEVSSAGRTFVARKGSSVSN